MLLNVIFAKNNNIWCSTFPCAKPRLLVDPNGFQLNVKCGNGNRSEHVLADFVHKEYLCKNAALEILAACWLINKEFLFKISTLLTIMLASQIPWFPWFYGVLGFPSRTSFPKAWWTWLRFMPFKYSRWWLFILHLAPVSVIIYQEVQIITKIADCHTQTTHGQAAKHFTGLAKTML